MTINHFKSALKGLWCAIRGVSSYASILIQTIITLPGILFYMSLYFEGEVAINITKDAFLTSPLFENIIGISLILASFYFTFRLITREYMIVGTNIPFKSAWALDEKKRFSVEESVNFLRTMRKCGFPTIINPNVWTCKNEVNQIIGFLQVALSLRRVDLTQFTEDDFNEIEKFLSTNCCDDTIGIDKNKLEIFNDALPLMEILKGEIRSMTQEVSYTPSSISERTLFMEIPSICRTILLQKEAIERICSNTLKNEDFSTYIHAVEQTSFNLVKLTNELLKEINFPPEVLKSWHEIEDLKSIATSETMNLREFYQRSNKEEK